MSFRVTGKNVDVGTALQGYISERLSDNVEKYFNGSASGHVTIAKEGKSFRSDCIIHLSSGMDLQAHGESPDPYISFDLAADRLEKRLRRYTRRLKEHHRKRSGPISGRDVSSFIIAPDAGETDEPEDLNPAIIAESTAQVRDLSVGEAVMQLDLRDDAFLFFRNVSHGGLNVVYRRVDGNFGWIDPGVILEGDSVKTGNGQD